LERRVENFRKRSDEVRVRVPAMSLAKHSLRIWMPERIFCQAYFLESIFFKPIFLSLFS
jgi:hypothetical protein